MKLAFLYAGQGTQKAGMGRDLYESYPAFRAAFDAAQLEFDLRRMCFEDPDGLLGSTQYTQPCMVAFAAGVTAVLGEAGVAPDYAAGLSLGEYSALQAAGVFTAKEAVELAEAVRDMGYMPEQVQDFYPTPSTMSTCMFYTGVDPRTMEPIYVPRDPREKAMQRALIQYRKPENWHLVREALRRAGREDLVGFGPKCLIRPYPPKGPGAAGGSTSGRASGKGARGRAAGKGRTGAGGRDGSNKGAGTGGHGSNKGRNGKQAPGGGRVPGGTPKGPKGMSRSQNAAARNRAAQGRQGANRGGRRH